MSRSSCATLCHAVATTHHIDRHCLLGAELPIQIVLMHCSECIAEFRLGVVDVGVELPEVTELPLEQSIAMLPQLLSCGVEL